MSTVALLQSILDQLPADDSPPWRPEQVCRLLNINIRQLRALDIRGRIRLSRKVTRYPVAGLRAFLRAAIAAAEE